MPDEANVQRILDYIEHHRSQYALSALREQLLAAGYLSEDIDAAITRLAPQHAPVAAPEAPVAVPEAPVASPTPPQPEAQIQRMVEYLRQNSDRYNMDALREQLLAMPNDPTLVDVAIKRVQAERTVKTSASWPAGLGLSMLNLLLLPIVLTGLISAVSQSMYGDLVVFILLLWPLTVAGEFVAGLVLLRGPRARLGRILLFAVLFSIAIPIVLGALLFGICLVILAGSPGLFR